MGREGLAVGEGGGGGEVLAEARRSAAAMEGTRFIDASARRMVDARTWGVGRKEEDVRGWEENKGR